MEHVQTQSGDRLIAFTREEVRALDSAAIDKYGIPDAVLMENAGRATAHVALELLADQRPARAVVFCGKGNNGGDGYVVARYLLSAGHDVELFLTAAPEEIGGCARVFLDAVRAMDCRPTTVAHDSAGRVAERIANAHLVVDALLGTGLSGEVHAPMQHVIRAINKGTCPVLAVDIPSGLDANSGAALGACVKATRTVTYAGSKVGLYLSDGPAQSGKVSVVDIGIPRPAYEALGVRDFSQVFGRRRALLG